jgi:predicted O-methyltransferase YrrM
MENTELREFMRGAHNYVRAGGVNVYEGGASLAEASYLRDLARSAGTTLIAEIGFNVGFSALAFLASSPQARVVSFELDPRRSVTLAKEFVDSRYPERHELIVGSSLDTVPDFADTRPERFDLVFVDGGHDYRVAAADIRNAVRVARPGAVVVMDDLTPWLAWGVGPAKAWYEAVDDGLIEPFEYFVDGQRVDEVEGPGDRAWAAGRFA